MIHKSDCAVHNEPAMPNGKCDCGVINRIDLPSGSYIIADTPEGIKDLSVQYDTDDFTGTFLHGYLPNGEYWQSELICDTEEEFEIISPVSELSEEQMKEFAPFIEEDYLNPVLLKLIK